MFPLLFEVGLHAYSEGPDDGYGPTTVYTPPRDSPGIAEKVYGWSVPSSTEPREGQGNPARLPGEPVRPYRPT